MTELAVPENRHLEPVRPSGGAVAELVKWAEAAQAAYDIAQRIVVTSFVPEAFRHKPQDAAAAILAGVEVGLSPMGALRSFDIIQGVAAARAMTLRAIVQSAGHEIWVSESTQMRAVVHGRRRGQNEVHTSTWTMDRAKLMGLTGKANWKTQSTNMLLARATAECCRLTAADAILGIGYAAEELDGYLAEVQPEASPKAATRKAKRKPVEMPEPDLEPPAEADPREKQLNKMYALFNRLDVKDQDERHAFASEFLHHKEVRSFNDLTEEELGTVLEALERWAEQSEPGADDAQA